MLGVGVWGAVRDCSQGYILNFFCSLLRKVDEMMDDQMVLAYSMMGSSVLNVVVSVSLLLPSVLM